MTQPRNRRADARRSRAAILDAATRVLDDDPDAGLEAVATAAGVTRQTVYAHFSSRERLLAAVVDRLTEETAAAIDAADLDAGPAADALLRLLDAAQRVAARHPGLVRKITSLPVSPPDDRERHEPVADRLKRVIRRGQDGGEFDDSLPPDWLATATVALAHAAGEEVTAGRLSDAEAATALRTSLLRVLGTRPATG